MTLRNEMITVFGASGFIGRYVVRRLAKAGYRVRAATRRPHLAHELKPMGVVGQVQLVQANLRNEDSIRRAVDGADAVINLVGILAQGGKQTFESLQAEGAGLVAARLTDIPGSSEYFLGGVVAYANQAKIDQLGVDPALLTEHGAVSDEVAREMAAGARERFGADYALSVTGIAGPGGGSAEKPVGQVHIGLAGPDGVTARGFRFAGSRATIRERTVTAALDSVRRAMDAHR